MSNDAQPKCERCVRTKFSSRLMGPDEDPRGFCWREIYPDDSFLAAECNRIWGERVTKERDEAIELLWRIWRWRGDGVETRGFFDFLQRFPEKPADARKAATP